MNSWLSCTFRYCVHALPLCLLAGLSVACVNTPSEPAPPKETTAMTTPEHALAADGNPVLSAEEIGKRFLKLLEGLESREDLSLERVQHALVLPMKHFVMCQFTVKWVSCEVGVL